MKLLIFLIFLFSFLRTKGQELAEIDLKNFDYSIADSIAINFPKKKCKYYTDLVGPLIQNVNTDHEKLRVIFRWITDNIAYNYGNKTWDANKVVKSKKAVCAGYSALLKEMCNSAGIECEIIIGYSKTSVTDINKRLKRTDHAWNAVRLYDKWYLIDVTWATSGYDLRVHKIIKQYEELYFLTTPSIFVKNHLPKEKKWQLLDKPIKKAEFIKSPIFYSSYYENGIDKLEPVKGYLKLKLNDTLQMKIITKTEIFDVFLQLGHGKLYYTPLCENNENYIIAKQKFDRKGNYEMTLFLNNEAMASYRIKIK